MKLLRQVKPIEVKRCFVISDYVSHQKYSKQTIKVSSKKEYLQQLAKAKKVILELSEIMLDMIIKGEWAKRYKVYKTMEWYLGEVKVNEIGVWKRAGGLPLAWTEGSLKETGIFVKEALANNSKKLTQRSKTAIPGIIKNSIDIIQKEKYLFPIILPGGTMGRKGLKKMKGDIDDGCMRSIALAVNGKKTLKVYIGKKVKLKR
jgi:hypothetical protein